MALAPDSRLGPYDVTALIGQGGMGEVSRARDTKLDRDVALKVLPDLFADDPERLARCQREAKVLASLNHPNIASIYGLARRRACTHVSRNLGMSRQLTLSLVLCAFSALSSTAWAQARLTGADLQGTVRDATGLVLSGASVVVINVDTNVTRSATTDAVGHYLVAALPPGDYSIVASMSGFATPRRDGLTLLLGQLVTVDVTMAVAGLEEDITVTAEASLVSPSQTSVSSVIERRQIESLPINGRQFISFAALTPGVTPVGKAEPGAETSGLSFTGQRPRANNLMLDGFDNNDRVLGGAQASFSQGAIREFQVLTNSYSAEFGQAAGGIVNIVTKSGSNTFHGNMFVFHRNENLNAKDHFEKFDVFGNALDRDKSPFDQNQWGGTLGGPLRRDRTFFFVSLEQLNIQANNFVNIDPGAAAMLGAGGFPLELGNVPYDFKTTQSLAKLTHNWAPGNFLVLSGHMSDITNENFGQFGGTVAKSHGAAQFRNDWAVSGSQVNVLGANWVNEARVQFAHQNQETNALDPRCGGRCVTEAQGGPEVDLPGVALVGRTMTEPTDRVNRRVQIKNTLSYAGNRHTVKAGVDFIYIDQEARLPLNFGGSFTFAPLPAIPGLLPVPISAVQAFALGLPALYLQGYGNSSGPFTYKDFAAFVQDEWRFSSRLTLKAGLRYQTQLWFDDETTVSDVGGTTLSYRFPQDRDNFAPRVAVAFDPAGDGRTSIHGAYGLFFGNQLTTLLGSNIVLDGSPDGIRLQLVPFPGSVAAWQAPGHRLPEPTVPFPSTAVAVVPEMESPFSHQASVGISRTLGSDMSVAANFIYVRGKNQIGSLNYNPIIPSLGPGRRPNDVGGVAGTSAGVFQFTDFGESSYRGLLLSLRKRFSQRYEFLLSYTLSKAGDNSSSFVGHVNDSGLGRNPGDPLGLPLGFDPDSEKGPAPNDQRHRLVLSGSYMLPGDIQLAAIVSAASGRPFTPLAGADLNGDGLPIADRARRVPSDPNSVVGRNSQRMVKQVSVDLRVARIFELANGVSFEGLLEVFNLFNRTNFSKINNVFGVGAFPQEPRLDASGRITYGLYEQALAPRQIQLGIKLGF